MSTSLNEYFTEHQGRWIYMFIIVYGAGLSVRLPKTRYTTLNVELNCMTLRGEQLFYPTLSESPGKLEEGLHVVCRPHSPQPLLCIAARITW